jgi:hypothetical protein
MILLQIASQRKTMTEQGTKHIKLVPVVLRHVRRKASQEFFMFKGTAGDVWP